MTNLAPIVDSIDKPIVSFIEGRFQTFFDNRFFYYLLCLYRQLRIKPIISDRQSHRHFPHIQEMGRIPVRKRGRFQHLALRPFQKLILPSHSIGITQNENAA